MCALAWGFENSRVFVRLCLFMRGWCMVGAHGLVCICEKESKPLLQCECESVCVCVCVCVCVKPHFFFPFPFLHPPCHFANGKGACSSTTQRTWLRRLCCCCFSFRWNGLAYSLASDNVGWRGTCKGQHRLRHASIYQSLYTCPRSQRKLDA